MSKVYDNWDRLVGAVLKREELRRIAHCESLSSSNSSDFSLDSSLGHYLDEPIEYEEILKATNKYRPFEQGGIGIVFKGWIDEHTLTASKHGFGTAVAVKWNYGGFKEHRAWFKEIKYLIQLHHPTVVRFIGYCLEEDKMIKVYEFMPKGSLENHLYEYRYFPWETRIKVATDAARGLSFLHEREVPVIHRDIKTANILLDGLARDGGNGDTSGVFSEVVGTHGYAAPEYVATGWLTTKCDVYGFGVVLLELLSGRRVLDTNRVAKEQHLVEWAKPCLTDKRKLSRIMDYRLKEEYPHKAAYKVAKLASRCLSSDPTLRPRMDEVVVALQYL
ncbi:hypothetical protein ACS0TY_036159 [Phlomoides rotata]